MRSFVVGLFLFALVVFFIAPALIGPTQEVADTIAEQPVARAVNVSEHTEGLICAAPLGLAFGVLCGVLADALTGRKR